MGPYFGWCVQGLSRILQFLALFFPPHTSSFALSFRVSLSHTMADPLSISAAAVGFVAFALQVATTSAEFLQDANGFPNEFTKLSLATNEFATYVRRLAPTIEKVEARYGIKGSFPFFHIVANVLQIKQTR
jgi:hypothetical protein